MIGGGSRFSGGSGSYEKNSWNSNQSIPGHRISESHLNTNFFSSDGPRTPTPPGSDEEPESPSHYGDEKRFRISFKKEKRVKRKDEKKEKKKKKDFDDSEEIEKSTRKLLKPVPTLQTGTVNLLLDSKSSHTTQIPSSKFQMESTSPKSVQSLPSCPSLVFPPFELPPYSPRSPVDDEYIDKKPTHPPETATTQNAPSTEDHNNRIKIKQVIMDDADFFSNDFDIFDNNNNINKPNLTQLTNEPKLQSSTINIKNETPNDFTVKSISSPIREADSPITTPRKVSTHPHTSTITSTPPPILATPAAPLQIATAKKRGRPKRSIAPPSSQDAAQGVAEASNLIHDKTSSSGGDRNTIADVGGIKETKANDALPVVSPSHASSKLFSSLEESKPSEEKTREKGRTRISSSLDQQVKPPNKRRSRVLFDDEDANDRNDDDLPTRRNFLMDEEEEKQTMEVNSAPSTLLSQNKIESSIEQMLIVNNDINEDYVINETEENKQGENGEGDAPKADEKMDVEEDVEEEEEDNNDDEEEDDDIEEDEDDENQDESDSSYKSDRSSTGIKSNRKSIIISTAQQQLQQQTPQASNPNEPFPFEGAQSSAFPPPLRRRGRPPRSSQALPQRPAHAVEGMDDDGSFNFNNEDSPVTLGRKKVGRPTSISLQQSLLQQKEKMGEMRLTAAASRRLQLLQQQQQVNFSSQDVANSVDGVTPQIRKGKKPGRKSRAELAAIQQQQQSLLEQQLGNDSLTPRTSHYGAVNNFNSPINNQSSFNNNVLNSVLKVHALSKQPPPVPREFGFGSVLSSAGSGLTALTKSGGVRSSALTRSEGQQPSVSNATVAQGFLSSSRAQQVIFDDARVREGLFSLTPFPEEVTAFQSIEVEAGLNNMTNFADDTLTGTPLDVNSSEILPTDTNTTSARDIPSITIGSINAPSRLPPQFATASSNGSGASFTWTSAFPLNTATITAHNKFLATSSALRSSPMALGLHVPYMTVRVAPGSSGVLPSMTLGAERLHLDHAAWDACSYLSSHGLTSRSPAADIVAAAEEIALEEVYWIRNHLTANTVANINSPSYFRGEYKDQGAMLFAPFPQEFENSTDRGFVEAIDGESCMSTNPEFLCSVGMLNSPADDGANRWFSSNSIAFGRDDLPDTVFQSVATLSIPLEAMSINDKNGIDDDGSEVTAWLNSLLRGNSLEEGDVITSQCRDDIIIDKLTLVDNLNNHRNNDICEEQDNPNIMNGNSISSCIRTNAEQFEFIQNTNKENLHRLLVKFGASEDKVKKALYSDVAEVILSVRDAIEYAKNEAIASQLPELLHSKPTNMIHQAFLSAAADRSCVLNEAISFVQAALVDKHNELSKVKKQLNHLILSDSNHSFTTHYNFPSINNNIKNEEKHQNITLIDDLLEISTNVDVSEEAMSAMFFDASAFSDLLSLELSIRKQLADLERDFTILNAAVADEAFLTTQSAASILLKSNFNKKNENTSVTKSKLIGINIDSVKLGRHFQRALFNSSDSVLNQPHLIISLDDAQIATSTLFSLINTATNTLQLPGVTKSSWDRAMRGWIFYASKMKTSQSLMERMSQFALRKHQVWSTIVEAFETKKKHEGDPWSFGSLPVRAQLCPDVLVPAPTQYLSAVHPQVCHVRREKRSIMGHLSGKKDEDVNSSNATGSSNAVATNIGNNSVSVSGTNLNSNNTINNAFIPSSISNNPSITNSNNSNISNSMDDNIMTESPYPTSHPRPILPFSGARPSVISSSITAPGVDGEGDPSSTHAALDDEERVNIGSSRRQAVVAAEAESGEASRFMSSHGNLTGPCWRWRSMVTHYVPPMLQMPEDRISFITENAKISEPAALESNLLKKYSWAIHEVRQFLKLYLATPKNFRKIATMMKASDKDDRALIHFFYSHKWTFNLKNILIFIKTHKLSADHREQIADTIVNQLLDACRQVLTSEESAFLSQHQIPLCFLSDDLISRAGAFMAASQGPSRSAPIIPWCPRPDETLDNVSFGYFLPRNIHIAQTIPTVRRVLARGAGSTYQADGLEEHPAPPVPVQRSAAANHYIMHTLLANSPGALSTYTQGAAVVATHVLPLTSPVAIASDPDNLAAQAANEVSEIARQIRDIVTQQQIISEAAKNIPNQMNSGLAGVQVGSGEHSSSAANLQTGSQNAGGMQSSLQGTKRRISETTSVAIETPGNRTSGRASRGRGKRGGGGPSRLIPSLSGSHSEAPVSDGDDDINPVSSSLMHNNPAAKRSSMSLRGKRGRFAVGGMHTNDRNIVTPSSASPSSLMSSMMGPLSFNGVIPVSHHSPTSNTLPAAMSTRPVASPSMSSSTGARLGATALRMPTTGASALLRPLMQAQQQPPPNISALGEVVSSSAVASGVVGGGASLSLATLRNILPPMSSTPANSHNTADHHATSHAPMNTANSNNTTSVPLTTSDQSEFLQSQTLMADGLVLSSSNPSSVISQNAVHSAMSNIANSTVEQHHGDTARRGDTIHQRLLSASPSSLQPISSMAPPNSFRSGSHSVTLPSSSTHPLIPHHLQHLLRLSQQQQQQQQQHHQQQQQQQQQNHIASSAVSSGVLPIGASTVQHHHHPSLSPSNPFVISRLVSSPSTSNILSSGPSKAFPAANSSSSSLPSIPSVSLPAVSPFIVSPSSSLTSGVRPLRISPTAFPVMKHATVASNVVPHSNTPLSSGHLNNSLGSTNTVSNMSGMSDAVVGTPLIHHDSGAPHNNNGANHYGK